MFIVQAVVHDAVGEIEEVGCEGEGPGSCYCCGGSVSETDGRMGQ